MAEFINTVDILGDEVVTNSIIDKSITEYKDNNITSIGGSAFYGCTALTTVDFPMVRSINVGGFSSCTALKTVDFPMVTNIGSTALADCTALKTVDFPMVTNIGTYAFIRCSILTSIIIRSSTVCSLSNTNAFDSTLIKSGTGYIYVPRALLSDDDATKDYRRATNWSNYSTQFRALEDYTVDGTITGELDPNKI